MSSLAACRSCHLNVQRMTQLHFVDLNFFCLSLLLLVSNKVQVLKIVALVQDSNLIIGKVHGFLMLYAS